MTNPQLWFIDLAILFGLWGFGILCIRALLPGSRLDEQAALGFGLGTGLFSWFLFLLSWAGIPLTPWTILITYALLLAFALLGGMLSRRETRSGAKILDPADHGTHGTTDILGWVIFGLFGLALLVISVGLSYYFWDAMAIWSAKGYGIGLTRSIQGAASWGAKGLAYPLNIPLTISVFFAFDQDSLPGSKLIFPAFFLALLIGLRVLFRKQGLPPWLAWFGVFATAASPLLLQYSLMGYANIPYAYYGVLGIIWIGLGFQGNDKARIGVGALLLALSIWTRLEGLEFWPILIAGIFLVWRRTFLDKGVLLRVLLPGVVVGGIWFLFGKLNQASTGETVLLSDALHRFASGEVHLQAIFQILRFTAYMVIKQHTYGFLLPVMIGLSIPGFLLTALLRKDRFLWTLLGSALLSSLGVMFMYYLTSYDSSLQVTDWLGTGYDRMLFGAVILFAAASLPILWRVGSRGKGSQGAGGK